MTGVRVQRAAALRIEEIYRYSRERWGEAQAEAYLTGLFEAFAGVAPGAHLRRHGGRNIRNHAPQYRGRVAGGGQVVKKK